MRASRARVTQAPRQNRLLAILPRTVQQRFETFMERATLESKTILYDVDQRIERVYFPITCVGSLVLLMESEQVGEVGTVGNEGVIGLPVYLGADRSPTRAIVQVPGDAWRMGALAFKREMANDGVFPGLVRRYAQALFNQISQSVVCNNLHSIEQRLSRWLLMTQDRVGADEFPLTQEFIAQMLGVRRPSVTIAAGILQKAGLIEYRRGRITILDRSRLERASCECYRVVRKEFDRLLGVPTG